MSHSLLYGLRLCLAGLMQILLEGIDADCVTGANHRFFYSYELNMDLLLYLLVGSSFKVERTATIIGMIQLPH